MIKEAENDRLAALAARIAKAEEQANPSLRNQGEGSAAQRSALARVMRIGTDFVSTVLAGLGLGWFADEQLGTAPWLMLSLLIVGCGIAFWNLVRASEAKQEEKTGTSPEE